jgi:hypothetical protein
MNASEIKKLYGEEYPAAVVIKGVRIPLSNESQFTRSYMSRDRNLGGCDVSRFMDGSASMTASQLQRQWVGWNSWQRVEFCQSCCWLYQQPDFTDMLRFIIQHGGPDEWSAIAGLTATYLPREEAFRFLLDALRARGTGICSNIIQAIAITKHPDAEATLRQHLRSVWDNPTLWNDDGFLNWVAADAKGCIQYLIELGASPADFEEQVRRLSEHVCKGNRDSCRRWLSKHYSWLK